MEPVVITKQGAQGDVLFQRVRTIPKDAKVEAHTGRVIVAHSETGHHHAITASDSEVILRRVERDPFTCYLTVASEHVDVVHHRSFDTHQTLRILQGKWLVRRQREYTPEGFRMVQD